MPRSGHGGTAANRKAALSRFRQAKSSGGGGNALLDQDDESSDDGIYDQYTEEEYRQLVHARQEREDFVVDDEGLGYADDGEEIMYKTDDHDNRIEQKRKASNTLTDKALKQAKRLKQAAAAAAAASSSSSSLSATANAAAPGGAKSSSNQPKIWAMWGKQQQDGGTSGTTAAGNSSNSSSNNRRPPPRNAFAKRAPKLDDLLGQLDDPEALLLPSSMKMKKQQQNKKKKSRRQQQQHQQPQPHTAVSLSSSSSSAHHNHHKDQHQKPPPPARHAELSQDPIQTTQGNDYDDDDFYKSGDDAIMFDDEHNNNHKGEDNNVDPVPMADQQKSSSSSSSLAGNVNKNKIKPNGVDAIKENRAAVENGTRDEDETVKDEKEEATATGPTAVPQPKRRFARTKVLSDVKPKPARPVTGPTATTTSTTTTTKAIVITNTLPNVEVMAEVTSGMNTANIGQLDLAKFLHHDEATAAATTTEEPSSSSSYLNMYWLDLAERSNGDILLFGKVALPPSEQQQQGPTIHPAYVSCSVVVTGMQRNLFVLPKPESSFVELYQELTALFHKLLPKNGAWAAKKVVRSYAFDDPNIPRAATDYLKVVYDANFPVPDEAICSQGGTHFTKILNAQASLTELLLIKRKLTGPSWIRLRNPTVNVHNATTWCKLECTIASPKQILLSQCNNNNNSPTEKTGSSTAPPLKAPPLVTMSVHMQTVVNPKTHKSEVCAISAILHSNVALEGSTATTASSNNSSGKHHQQHQQQLTIIRPLTNVFPRHLEDTKAFHKEANERALLSRFLAQIGQWDPDVIVGHNLWGFFLQVLSERCNTLRLPNRLGRKRQYDWPKNEWGLHQAVAGRLIVDTYLSAQEFLFRETTYSLSNLAVTQLQTTRHEIEPMDIPSYYDTAEGVVHLARATTWDAQLVQKLLFKLQALPLTKQLTNIAGNLWSQTLRSNRAGRTEYLLLHEFHRLKYLAPEKKQKKTGQAAASTQAKYSGGLVLEPKKGLYDSFILLLDFNSLYPSLIQEYNLCFTTIDWATISDDTVPPVPDSSVEPGVLPRVIKSLVDRRRAVKRVMKSETNEETKRELDIRQQALKLTANSMYGCLGYSNSRFYAQPIAALVTSMGRETLQRTVDVAQNKVGLDVIYGDTDSIMINTRINDETKLDEVKKLGEAVKKEVNGLYKTLELEIDGIFRSMLLLKKKKYAAKTVLEVLPDKTIRYGQELKGLDLVRRDWCIASKDTGRFITEKILSGEDTELVVGSILTHLEELAQRMRDDKVPLDKYVITKGLSKHPNDYPDAKVQMHVQVAKRMLLNGKVVNTGDHVPYVVTEASSEATADGQAVPSPAERARHPEEITRSNGALKPDVEWYLTQQILPPVSRLCEPIEGLSQQTIAERLGLEASKYRNHVAPGSSADQDVTIDYTPASQLSDAERFKDVEKLKIHCLACGHYTDIPGVFTKEKDAASGMDHLVTGLRCTNPDCIRPDNWGHPSHFECYSRITNNMKFWVKGLTTRYYEGIVRCDEPSCGLVTRQCSVAGSYCLQRGCSGRLLPLHSESEVYNHLKYLASVFDIDHAFEQWEKKKVFGAKKDLLNSIHKDDRKTFEQLHEEAKRALEDSAFHWIAPSFWNEFFCVGAKQ